MGGGRGRYEGVKKKERTRIWLEKGGQGVWSECGVRCWIESGYDKDEFRAWGAGAERDPTVWVRWYSRARIAIRSRGGGLWSQICFPE